MKKPEVIIEVIILVLLFIIGVIILGILLHSELLGDNSRNSVSSQIVIIKTNGDVETKKEEIPYFQGYVKSVRNCECDYCKYYYNCYCHQYKKCVMYEEHYHCFYYWDCKEKI